MSKPGFEERASAAWGQPPSWVLALARACDRSTQARVAADLVLPASYVSWALCGDRFQYHARVEAAVRARLMGETADCPILGEIPVDRCRELRRARGRAQGPVEKSLRTACPSCPFNPSVVGEEAANE